MMGTCEVTERICLAAMNASRQNVARAAEPLEHQSCDYIVATYSLHHLKDEQKVSFLRTLYDHLNENGQSIKGLHSSAE